MNVPEFTVSELSRALKRTVEDAYGFVRVRGELGRVVRARSGHVYADLKDDKSVLASVMWKGLAAGLQFDPEEGLEVVCEGKLTTYPGQSKYQLVIERMAPAGVGALMALLEKRKAALAAEGLFDPARKKPLPALPDVVGVVTSPTGAVIRDILHRVADRFPRHVLVWPVLVQGEKAGGQIAAAIRGFNALPAGGPIPRPDVLIVARGGGSIEDLWAFNEEAVVRAAAASEIPLVSAVGHETDTTLIDYASDVRAPTPTGAAELVLPVRADLGARIETLGGRAATAMTRVLERRSDGLRAAVRGLPRPADMLGLRAQRLDAAAAGLRAGLKAAADRAAVRFQRAAARLSPEAMVRDVDRRAGRLAEFAARAQRAQARVRADAAQNLARAAARLDGRLVARRGESGARALDQAVRALASAARRDLAARETRLAAASARLEALNPTAVMARGFALVRDEAGGVVRSAAGLKAGQRVDVAFADGARAARIEGGDAASKRRGRRNEDEGGPGQGALF